MTKKLDYKLLSDSEKELILSVRPKRLRRLDEDELLDLHRRVRRARNKYAKLYRRRAAEQVREDRTRSKASKKHARVAAKVEIFEDALSKVSRRLAVVARDRAEALRDERLAAAGAPARPDAPRRTPRDARSSDSNRRARTKRPIERRKVSSERSATRRSAARRGR